MELVSQRHVPAALPQRTDPVPIVEKACWAPGCVYRRKYLLRRLVFEPLGRPARRQLVYRIRYPRPKVNKKRHLITLLQNNLPSKCTTYLCCGHPYPNLLQNQSCRFK
jgi:hypothetical protein